MIKNQRWLLNNITIFLLLSAALSSNASTTLTDNLAGTSGGATAASGSVWEAQSFSTDSQNYVLNSVSLLLSSADSGAAVYLYSDSSSAPSQLLGQLNLSDNYSSSLSPTVFTATNLSLTANTSYWVVLNDVNGSVNWSYQATDSGTSANWAEWDGSFWATSTSYPYQLSVVATPAAVPLPASFSLLLAGLASLGFTKRKSINPSSLSI